MSHHPLIDVVANLLFLLETKDNCLPDEGGCAMLNRDDDGIATCLIWKYLGVAALPEVCREFPTGEDFDGDCEAMKKRVLAENRLSKDKTLMETQ
jgi:hypothetical protein